MQNYIVYMQFIIQMGDPFTVLGLFSLNISYRLIKWLVAWLVVIVVINHTNTDSIVFDKLSEVIVYCSTSRVVPKFNNLYKFSSYNIQILRSKIQFQKFNHLKFRKVKS